MQIKVVKVNYMQCNVIFQMVTFGMESANCMGSYPDEIPQLLHMLISQNIGLTAVYLFWQRYSYSCTNQASQSIEVFLKLISAYICASSFSD